MQEKRAHPAQRVRVVLPGKKEAQIEKPQPFIPGDDVVPLAHAVEIERARPQGRALAVRFRRAAAGNYACDFRHALHNAVSVHLFAQAQQDVKARFRHRHIHFANVRVHRVLTPFSAMYRTAMH